MSVKGIPESVNNANAVVVFPANSIAKAIQSQLYDLAQIVTDKSSYGIHSNITPEVWDEMVGQLQQSVKQLKDAVDRIESNTSMHLEYGHYETEFQAEYELKIRRHNEEARREKLAQEHLQIEDLD